MTSDIIKNDLPPIKRDILLLEMAELDKDIQKLEITRAALEKELDYVIGHIHELNTKKDRMAKEVYDIELGSEDLIDDIKREKERL